MRKILVIVMISLFAVIAAGCATTGEGYVGTEQDALRSDELRRAEVYCKSVGKIAVVHRSTSSRIPRKYPARMGDIVTCSST